MGRSCLYGLYPLIMAERPAKTRADPAGRNALIPLESQLGPCSTFPPADIEERLDYGDLPGIVLPSEEDRRPELRSYATVHLEEEIRREALVKEWGAFLNLLRMAAISHAA